MFLLEIEWLHYVLIPGFAQTPLKHTIDTYSKFTNSQAQYYIQSHDHIAFLLDLSQSLICQNFNLSKGKEFICNSEILGELVNDMMFSKDELMSQTLTKPLVIVLLGFKKGHISFNEKLFWVYQLKFYFYRFVDQEYEK